MKIFRFRNVNFPAFQPAFLRFTRIVCLLLHLPDVSVFFFLSLFRGLTLAFSGRGSLVSVSLATIVIKIVQLK